MLEEIKVWLSALWTGAVENLLAAVLILIIGLLIMKIIMAVVKKSLAKTKLEKAAHGLITSLIGVVMGVLLGLSVASALGIDVTGIVALASVLTLAISLALQNILANVIGGFTILSTHPFHSGDFVEIAGQAGTVEDINMTYTRLATPDNKQVSIPNSAVVAAQIVNYTAAGTRRVDVAVSASYEMDPEAVIEALTAAGQVEKVLANPAPFAAVESYGESAVRYTLRVWCRSEDYWDVFFAVNNNVKTTLKARNIRMTYPHINVHLDK